MKKKNRWWDRSIGYIIYPSTFQDSNGDGIGDLRGITSRLDYLHWLGVDLLWVCPIFASPMDDNGYDVSDYKTINPLFGTNEDFKNLLKEAHARGIRVCVDFVLNHTSDEHPWFQKALEDPESEERSYYIFKKGKKKDGQLVPPNNWKGFFNTSVWTRVGESEDYYLHIFSVKMPDLNWENPKLRQKIYEIARHYLDMGVDGFRLDALAHLAKEPSFRDSKAPLDENGWAYDPSRFSNRPRLYDYLDEFKEEVLSKYPCLSVGEVGGGISPKGSLCFSDREKGSIDMVFNFDTAWCNGAFGSLDRDDAEIRTDVMTLKRNFLRWHKACANRSDLPFYWCNHDHPRVLSQYGSLKWRKESGKMLSMILLFLYGTPWIYNGDEIGMSNVDYDKPEDFFDDVGNKNHVMQLRRDGYSEERITNFLRRCSRVSARSPMQWDGTPMGGFSSKEYKNRMNRNHLEGVNVEEELRDKDSLLWFFKKAIALRKKKWVNDLVQRGGLRFLYRKNEDVMAFVHERDGRKLILIANMRDFPVNLPSFPKNKKILLHNYKGTSKEGRKSLRPFEAYLLEA